MRLLWTAILIVIGCAELVAQQSSLVTKSNDPFISDIEWKLYKFRLDNISIKFPKRPVVSFMEDPCSRQKVTSYFAFASNTVYEMRVASKNTKPLPKDCAIEPAFGLLSMMKRVKELESKFRKPSSKVLLSGRSAFFFRMEGEDRWLVENLKSNKWVELGIYYRARQSNVAEGFIKSFSYSSLTGEEIGDGSPQVIGDTKARTFSGQTVDEVSQVPCFDPNILSNGSGIGPPIPECGTIPIRIIEKPQARYTEAARNASIHGKVRIKVELLANGSIGRVTPLAELPNGLTEQAELAARRIVFIPKMINGVPIHTIVTLEYGFEIY